MTNISKKPTKQAILAIDIGGSHIKAAVLNKNGEYLSEYQRIETPKIASPENTAQSIAELVKNFPQFDKIAVGFPGFVKDGVIKTAPNLGNHYWENVNLGQILAKQFEKPTRVVNDADFQGLALINRKGLEMVITLGTGFGTALFMGGALLPHLELAHLPVTKSKDYDAFVGEKALQKEGLETWNNRMKEVLNTFKTVVNYDNLFLSGGNAKRLNFKLDKNIQTVSNKDGIKGGAFLWQVAESYCVKTAHPNQ
ncbi:MAG: ROK family protein [Sphingobacteriales bacterium]|nr:MAG: ROK family protein [Sphingobacteriales bacterium]TAF81339.1 MAG: ROK family protein [Sphingobacteriales bacterium]